MGWLKCEFEWIEPGGGRVFYIPRSGNSSRSYHGS